MIEQPVSPSCERKARLNYINVLDERLLNLSELFHWIIVQSHYVCENNMSLAILLESSIKLIV